MVEKGKDASMCGPRAMVDRKEIIVTVMAMLVRYILFPLEASANLASFRGMEKSVHQL